MSLESVDLVRGVSLVTKPASRLQERQTLDRLCILSARVWCIWRVYAFLWRSPVTRSMAGLLAAVGTAMSVLVALAHGDVAIAVVAVIAGVATGLATVGASSRRVKKNLASQLATGQK